MIIIVGLASVVVLEVCFAVTAFSFLCYLSVQC